MRLIHYSYAVFCLCLINGIQANAIYDWLGSYIGMGVNLAFNIVSDQAKWIVDSIEDKCRKYVEAFEEHDMKTAGIKLRLNYITPCCSYAVPISTAETLWDNPIFRQNKKLVIAASEYLTETVFDELQKAYMCRPDINFMVLETDDYVGVLDMWLDQNTIYIGDNISRTLKKLTDANPTVKIHLIGHSLAAHFMGYGARLYHKLTGRLVDRVTGLDPAKNCFTSKTQYTELDTDAARLVDVIHTNPGLLGQGKPIGHVDFYPGGEDPIQNGCIFIQCSHDRSITYFAESVYPGQESNFMASKCDTIENMRAKSCDTPLSVMGYAVNGSERGIYYLDVNSESPHGKNRGSSSDNVNQNCICHGVMC